MTLRLLLLTSLGVLYAEDPTLEHTATVTAGSVVEFHLTSLASSHPTVRGLPKAFVEVDYALGAATLDDGNVVMERYVSIATPKPGVYAFTIDLADDAGHLVKSIPFTITVTPRYTLHTPSASEGMRFTPSLPPATFLDTP